MVNENKGKEYTPTPHYSRKMVRQMLRSQIEQRDGYHNVSAKMHAYFDKYKQLYR